MRTKLLVAVVATILPVVPTVAPAQASAAGPRYPVRPAALLEAQEVELAMSAAPSEVSSRADVYVLRGIEFVKVRTGSNGCSCMVSRDLHEGSLYPICFDQEGSRSLLFHEMRATSLRARGLSEPEVKREVAAARASGALPDPERIALAYMMSSRQVLFSSPDSTGVRVGAWHPHIMIARSGLTASQAGLAGASLTYLQLASTPGEPLHEFVVLLPVWSDGTPAPAPRRR